MNHDIHQRIHRISATPRVERRIQHQRRQKRPWPPPLNPLIPKHKNELYGKRIHTRPETNHMRKQQRTRADGGRGDGRIPIPKQLRPVRPAARDPVDQPPRPQPRGAAPNREGAEEEDEEEPHLASRLAPPPRLLVRALVPWLCAEREVGGEWGGGDAARAVCLACFLRWLRRVDRARWAGPRGVPPSGDGLGYCPGCVDAVHGGSDRSLARMKGSMRSGIRTWLTGPGADDGAARGVWG